MFIERITKSDLDKLAKLYGCNLYEHHISDDGSLYVEFSTGSMGPQPEFWLSDFDCTASPYYKHAEKEIKKDWQRFLFKKFGQE